MTQTLEPGATLGVFGSGQLGRMFALAAREMGYRVHVYSPDRDTPTGQVADVEVAAPYEDLEAVANFAKSVDVITYEFENIHLETINAAAEHTPVHPAGNVLHTTQNRLREKTFLQSAGLATTPFARITSVDELRDVATSEGKGVLKTAAWGYDGKGQVVVETPQDAESAWSKLETTEAVFENFVDFSDELSVVAARTTDGQMFHYGPILNTHRNHILDVSVSPAGLSEELAAEAIRMASVVMQELDVVGVLCVEFFLTRGNELLINELAPRPHNSGHLTIDGYLTSQFEQQVRAVCGLPLGSTQLLRPVAMANLLGDLWEQGTPNWAAALSDPEIKLHLYGKSCPRVGRKMGHLTALGDTPQDATSKALAARDGLLVNCERGGSVVGDHAGNK